MSSIEGIPEGWELVRVGKLMPGDYWLNGDGLVVRWDFHHQSAALNYLIIRKIENPKTYRAFVNAAEFKPYRDRWWMFKDDTRNHRRPPQEYDDRLYDSWEWEEMFECATFDDGTPFGVEVTS